MIKSLTLLFSVNGVKFVSNQLDFSGHRFVYDWFWIECANMVSVNQQSVGEYSPIIPIKYQVACNVIVFHHFPFVKWIPYGCLLKKMKQHVSNLGTIGC